MQIPDYVVASCGVVRCEPTWSWAPPPLKDFDLWFIFAGQGTLKMRGIEHAVYPGKTFLFKPGDQFLGQHDPRRPLSVCFLHFSVQSQGRARRNPATIPGLDPLPTHGELEDVAYHEAVLRNVIRLFHSKKSEALPQAILGLHSTLLALRTAEHTRSLPAEQRQLRERFLAIARTIEEDPGRAPSIAQLAEQTGYTPDHFTRLFTKILTVSPKEFCLRARLHRAKELLRETPMPLKAVAQALGYSDEFFLSRQFKQRVGMSPTQWRQSRSDGLD